jgi:hypothetical protein
MAHPARLLRARRTLRATRASARSRRAAHDACMLRESRTRIGYQDLCREADGPPRSCVRPVAARISAARPCRFDATMITVVDPTESLNPGGSAARRPCGAFVMTGTCFVTLRSGATSVRCATPRLGAVSRFRSPRGPTARRPLTIEGCGFEMGYRESQAVWICGCVSQTDIDQSPWSGKRQVQVRRP